MIHKRFLGIGLMAVTALGLGACVDPYAYGRAPGYYDDGGYYSEYDRYYGDPYGFRYVPVGTIGLGFGWYNNFYYPGVGGYVYDRRGVRRAWSQQQRAYWQPRVAQRQNFRRDNAGIGNRIGRGIAQQQQQNRQRAQIDRRGNRIDQQQLQVERQGNRIDRRGNQIDRRGNDLARQQAQAERQVRSERPERQARAEQPVRAERPAQAERPVRAAQVERRSQADMRQQYQRQQQSYGGGDRRGRQQSRQRN